MAIKLLADKIQIGNFNLYEDPRGIVYDGIIKAEAYQETLDPLYANNILLIKTSGFSNANNRFIKDQGNNLLTVNSTGNVCTGSFTPFNENYSVYFDGSNDFLALPANNSYNFSTNNFTIECFVKFIDGNTNSTRMIWTNYNSFTTGSMFFGKHTNQSGRVCVFIANYSGGTPIVADPQLPPTNAWVHYALQRAGDDFMLFRDGVRVAVTAWGGGDVTSGVTACQIGGNSESSGGFCLLGYIANMRITTGSPRYNNFPNTVFLPYETKFSNNDTNTTGVFCQTYRFEDDFRPTTTGVTPFTVTGTPSISAETPMRRRFSYSSANNGGSCFFDGSGDYLTINANSSFDVNTNPFTVEFWAYSNTTGTTRYIAGQSNAARTATTIPFRIFKDSSNRLQFNCYIGSTEIINQTSRDLPLNQWTHVVCTRDGGTSRIYFNGIQQTTNADVGLSGLNNSSNAFGIGCLGESTSETWSGMLSGFRFINGACLYTQGTTFTPPTRPPERITTNISNTVLLLNFADSGIYDATGGHIIETMGDIDVNTEITVYNTGQRGSIYFDGSGDYLRINNSPSLRFSNSDFTVEGWINSQSNSVALATILNFGWNFNGTYAPLLIVNNSGTLTAYSSSANSSWDIFSAQTFGTLTLGTWHHFAITRFGSQYRFYRDGIALANVTSSATPMTPANTFTIGSSTSGDAANTFNGYMQDIRITKGIARYTTATFTPPVFEHASR